MTTKLIVIRHAKCTEDGLKPLSGEGRAVQRKMAERLKEEGVALKLVLTSPLLRAQQSAEIVGEIFHAPVVEEPALGEDFDEEVILHRIERGETTALVGHMPTLAPFVEKLAGCPVLPDGICKSGIVVLTFEDKIGWGKANFENYLRP